MTQGRVIAVVGPSGVGKDSIMAALSDASPEFEIVTRVITRPANESELNNSIDVDQFIERAAQGAFCLHWSAHGLFYGIPDIIRHRVDAGQSFLINLSRSVLTEANKIFPQFSVLNLTARPEVLAKRLAKRGRETESDILARLNRSGTLIDGHLNSITIENDGPFHETVAAILSAIELERV